MKNLLSIQLDYIYLFYGFVFFLCAVFCWIVIRQEKYHLKWKWLMSFCLVHGSYEWLELFSLGFAKNPLLIKARLVFLAISFLLLIEFGRSGFASITGKNSGRWIYLILCLFIPLGAPAGIPGLNDTVRYSLCFIGGIGTAWVVYKASRSQPIGSRPLAFIALCLLCFAILGGLIVPQSSLPIAAVINTNSFLAFAGLPVQLCRGVVVLLMAIGIWRYSQAWRQAAIGIKKIRQIDRSVLWMGVLLLFVFICGWAGTEWGGKREEERQRNYLLNLTKAAAGAINPVHVRNLSGTPADEKDNPDYTRLRQQLVLIEKAISDIRWVYLMGKKNGKIFFMVDSVVEDSEDHAAPGDPYDDAPPELHALFDSPAPKVVGPYNDTWGDFISGFAPVYDFTTHELTAILGIDVDTRLVKYSVTIHRLPFIGLACFLSLLVMSIFLYQRSVNDFTELLVNNEALLLEAQRLAQIGNWSFNLITWEVLWSEEMFKIMDVPRNVKPTFAVFQEVIYPADRQAFNIVIEDALSLGRESYFDMECRIIRRNGDIRDISIHAAIVRKENGKPLGVFGTAHDITERKFAEAKILKSLQEKELLLREINHRVKNNLQIINSLFNLQLRKFNDERFREIIKESHARIRSISLVHEKLYESGDFVRINVKEYVTSLVGNIKDSFSVDPDKINIDIRIAEDVALDINQVLHIGLIINELTTNAFKYAFPGKSKGTIVIGCGLNAQRRYVLVFSDDGAGLPADIDFSSVKTLGLELVATLARQLGEFEVIRENGTMFRIVLNNPGAV
jgi:two-component sensor histidine kinase